MSYLTNPYRYVVPAVTWYDELEHAGSAVESGWATAITERGEGTKTNASAMIGNKVTKVQVYLKKFGSPSGDITCAVKAQADNSNRVTIGILDVDDLTESMVLRTFDTSTNPSYELDINGDLRAINVVDTEILSEQQSAFFNYISVTLFQENFTSFLARQSHSNCITFKNPH